MNNNYLLQINLEDVIKSQKNEPKEISDWIFNTYCDVFSLKLISQKQVIKLIQKILERKKNRNSQTDIKNLKLQLFEPDNSRKQEEDLFYKSNQNFFSEGKDKIKLIEEYELKDDKISNKNATRNFSNGKVDFDENNYSNDLSIESLHSY